MTGSVAARAPWIVWGVGVAMLAVTLTLTALNHFAEGDAYFLPLAVAMILGYSTAGAVLASRSPGSRIGWLMIAIGVIIALVGLTGEYATYAYVTMPARCHSPRSSRWQETPSGSRCSPPALCWCCSFRRDRSRDIDGATFLGRSSP
jgi:hypothetical protein